MPPTTGALLHDSVRVSGSAGDVQGAGANVVALRRGPPRPELAAAAAKLAAAHAAARRGGRHAVSAPPPLPPPALLPRGGGGASAAAAAAALASAVPDAALRAAVRADALAAADLLFAALPDVSALRARLEVITKQSCPRWHADSVGARCLVTYTGPGTLFVPNRCVAGRGIAGGRRDG
jgi:hypothetical protein